MNLILSHVFILIYVASVACSTSGLSHKLETRESASSINVYPAYPYIFAFVNSSLTITCNTSAQYLNLRLYKTNSDSVDFKSGKKSVSFKFDRVKQLDQGKYVCGLENADDQLSKTFYLIVLGIRLVFTISLL